MDNWYYFQFEEMLDIVKEIIEEEKTEREKGQNKSNMPSINPGNMMSNMNNMINRFSK